MSTNVGFCLAVPERRCCWPDRAPVRSRFPCAPDMLKHREEWVDCSSKKRLLGAMGTQSTNAFRASHHRACSSYRKPGKSVRVGSYVKLWNAKIGERYRSIHNIRLSNGMRFLYSLSAARGWGPIIG